jgi:hypothetical protein
MLMSPRPPFLIMTDVSIFYRMHGSKAWRMSKHQRRRQTSLRPSSRCRRRVVSCLLENESRREVLKEQRSLELVTLQTLSLSLQSLHMQGSSDKRYYRRLNDDERAIVHVYYVPISMRYIALHEYTHTSFPMMIAMCLIAVHSRSMIMKLCRA